MIQAIRRGSWLNRDRLRAYTGLLFLAQVSALGILLFRDRQPAGGLGITDFLGFYAAGRLAAPGAAAGAYDYARHLALERQIVPDADYIAFFYPPIFLLAMWPLARLPYAWAFLVWSILKVIAYAGSLAAILKDRWRVWPLLVVPAGFLDLWAGQNGLLSAALFGAATVWVDRRPVLAGLLFGALCYKPQLIPLVGIALITGRYWGALGAATVAAFGLACAAWLVFGMDTWRAFIALSGHVPAVFAAGGVDFGLMASGFAAVLALGSGILVATLVQALCTLGATLAVAWVWRRGGSLAVRSAVLVSGVLVASPVLLFYDLAMTGIGLAWIWEDGRVRGWRDWEKLGLLAIFLGAPVAKSLGAAYHWPVSALVVIGLFGMALNRASLKRDGEQPV